MDRRPKNPDDDEPYGDETYDDELCCSQICRDLFVGCLRRQLGDSGLLPLPTAPFAGHSAAKMRNIVLQFEKPEDHTVRGHPISWIFNISKSDTRKRCEPDLPGILCKLIDDIFTVEGDVEQAIF